MPPRHLLGSIGLCTALLAACGPSGNPGGDDDSVTHDDASTPIDAAIPIDAPGPPPIPAHCLATAERGLAWLVQQQQFDGSWGFSLPVAATSFAVLKLETYAREIGRSPFDPGFVYANQVARGLDYIFTHATPTPISMQPAGNPDSNGNGQGIMVSGLMYENAIALMAIAGGGEPDRVVATPGSPVQTRTFKAVAQEMVDYLAFAQCDGLLAPGNGCNRGGWRYNVFDQDPSVGDNSVSQWATLALEYARHPAFHYEIMPPAWVISELNMWVSCIQIRDGGLNDGASGYDDPRDPSFINAYKTGALVQQFSFLGRDHNDPAAAAALDYLHRVWAAQLGVGWRGPPSDYLTMYSIMKGMESMAITDLQGIDWYNDFCTQLEAEQQFDGSWPASLWDSEQVGSSGLLSTEWALLVLERAAPPPEIIP